MKQISKISNYTKRIISVLMLFLQMRLVGMVSNSFNSNAVKEYHDIVKCFQQFLCDEEIEDPQQIYEYYNYAMWNGFFSENHELQYSLDRDIYIDNAGMSIMSGNAVCLNYADMLSLIYKEMGFNSYMVMCYVNPDNFNHENIRTDEEIERRINSSGSSILTDNIFVNTLTKFTGNHAITCVENNGELYFFDPTNLVYLNKTGINDLLIINGSGKFDIKYFTSLLLDNIDVFKVLTHTNASGYNDEVIEKQTININLDKLESFYNDQKENIENVDKNNDKNLTLLSMLIYSFIASFIVILTEGLIIRLANKFESDDLIKLFPKLKEYFSENNIKTEFEALKNYELLEKELGIKDNILKDILKKSITTLEILINNRNYYHLMLVSCLIHLGYDATSISAIKCSNKFIKKEVRLVKYCEDGKIYLYDYETEELIYMDSNKQLCSIDGKYKYYLKFDDLNLDKQDYTYMNRESIQEKMNNENNRLTKEDIKFLKRTKTLRH